MGSNANARNAMESLKVVDCDVMRIVCAFGMEMEELVKRWNELNEGAPH
jgi:hypothetical protein